MRFTSGMRMSVLLAGVAAVWAAPAAAEVTLSPYFTDHAVIQRGQPVTISGTANAGEAVTVQIADNKATAKADKDGNWTATLPALPAGGPYELTVSGGGDSVSVGDIMIGDVWLCSGQSNMELSVRRALDFDNQVRTFSDANLRLLSIEKATATTPQSRFATPPKWEPASGDSVPEFSAACYYMARDLRASRGVAIGVIDASWGGTQIRAWLSPEASRAIYGAQEAETLALFTRDPLAANLAFGERWINWWRGQSGDAPGTEPWVQPDRLTWTPMPAISVWDEWPGGTMKDFKGYVWARRTVTLTEAQAAKGATVSLGIIDDNDQTFVNGTAVGNTYSWSNARNYALPSQYWRAGENEIIVLIANSWSFGGMQGPADAVKLTFTDGIVMPLGEGWRYSVANAQVGSSPRPPWDEIAGLGLIHNAMVAPLGPVALDGVSWYQGESDVGQAGYADRVAALAGGYRAQFGREDLPVLVVGLANFGPPARSPTDSGWGALRNEQRLAAEADSAITLVPAIDLGERLDIHPANKIELGHRLARAAEGKPFPRAVVAAVVDGRIVVRFDGVTGDLSTWSSDRAIGFELCGDDAGSCRFADATANGATVEIAADGKPATRVRYGWADAPVVNLYDGADLPISSFEIPITGTAE